MDYTLANFELMCAKHNVLGISNYENYAQKLILNQLDNSITQRVLRRQ
jgi:hypothetical protein